jgi:hypothetical protein
MSVFNKNYQEVLVNNRIKIKVINLCFENYIIFNNFILLVKTNSDNYDKQNLCYFKKSELD